MDESTIIKSSFNANLPLKIIVHGFSSSIDAEWLHDMKNKLMENDKVNVIIGNKVSILIWFQLYLLLNQYMIV